MFLQYPVDLINIRNEFSSHHKGLDLGWDGTVGKNQNVKAVADGKVVYNRRQVTGGYVIGIYHQEYGLVSEYGHLLKDSQKVKEGDKVSKGQVIAKMGASGITTGPHLHLGLQKGRTLKYGKSVKWLDPLEYLVRYKKQAVSVHSKDKLKIVDTRIVHGVDDPPLLVHNKKNFLKSSRVKDLGFYNGDEIPLYQIDGSFVLCDKYLNYYSSSRFIK